MNRPEAWRPGATVEVLHLRARLLGAIRAFFARRGVLEVETPYLSVAGTPAPYLSSYRVDAATADARLPLELYLHTSPEFPMKMLLAAGCPDIYQICRVFRQGEIGAHHNNEYTLVEWYRQGLGYHELMEEVACLLEGLGLTGGGPLRSEKVTYSALFQRHLNLDPVETPIEDLASCARAEGLHLAGGRALRDRDEWLGLLLTHCVEPRMPEDRLLFVYEYPASQAALARLCPDDPRVAERFELYFKGIELANGFGELGDAVEQRRRFEAELSERRSRGLAPAPLDERFLAALGQGLPACSGVALGFDRLVMLAAGKKTLDEVMAFSAGRA